MTESHKSLLLASSSPYRKALLERLGIPFETATPGVNESSLPKEVPEELSVRLATDKALACAKPGFVVIGSDQVAMLGDVQLHKPGSFQAARDQLLAMSGSSVRFFTALSVLDADTAALVTEVITTNVVMRDYSNAEVERYIAHDQPLDCAGAFKWEAMGIAMIERIDSSDPTALEGLPLIVLSKILRERSFLVP